MDIHGHVNAPKYSIGGVDVTDKIKNLPSDTQTVLNSKLDKNTPIVSATHTKVTYDINGLITSATNLTANDIPSLDASKITSGTIDINRLPSGALPTLVIVANQTARFALTISQVQNGDTIKQTDNGLLYYVKDQNNLSNANGYEVYSATTDWSLVANKPQNILDISSISKVNNDIIQVKLGSYVNRSPSQFKNDLSLIKSDVGLSNVDNTSDINKPISSATQNALNLKADQSSLDISNSNISSEITNRINADLLKVNISDIKNDLISTDINKPLSANQGKILNDNKEPNIIAGTISQYYRGDKTFQTLNKISVGLGNVDNTADANKNVLSSTKLTTARTIGGVSFDGTTDVSLPGVNTAGNQNTSGNASTATSLQNARTINGVSFNGSANINIEDRRGTAIASASTITIGAAGAGESIHITGTTTIASLGNATIGTRRMLIFDGILTLTHNATSLILPGNANITTAIGDSADFICDSANNWKCLKYTRASINPIFQDGTSSVQNQLNGKEPTITAGTGSQYWSGSKTWVDFNASVSSYCQPFPIPIGDITGSASQTIPALDSKYNFIRCRFRAGGFASAWVLIDLRQSLSIYTLEIPTTGTIDSTTQFRRYNIQISYAFATRILSIVKVGMQTITAGSSGTIAYVDAMADAAFYLTDFEAII